MKKGATSQGRGEAFKNQRREGYRFFHRASRKECSSPYTLIFSPERSCQTANLQNYSMINLFKPPICGNLLHYIANRKVTQLILALSAYCPWKVLCGFSLRPSRRTPSFPEDLCLCLSGTWGHFGRDIVKQRQSLRFPIYILRLLPSWVSLSGTDFSKVFLSSMALPYSLLRHPSVQFIWIGLGSTLSSVLFFKF